TRVRQRGSLRRRLDDPHQARGPQAVRRAARRSRLRQAAGLILMAAKLHPELERYRADYPILADSVYMNSNSMGAMHRGSADALREDTELWGREGVEAWDHWPAIVDETADMVARFFNGGSGHTTLGENVATFQARI